MSDSHSHTLSDQPAGWETHVTVATVVQDNDRYLMVEELVDGVMVLNQPAGHLDPGESLIEAARRETLEETCWEVDIQGLVGSCMYTNSTGNISYFRTTFFARAIREHADRRLDPDIHRALWLSYEELLENKANMRSPRVLDTIEQYRNGHRYPLAFHYGKHGHVPGL